MTALVLNNLGSSPAWGTGVETYNHFPYNFMLLGVRILWWIIVLQGAAIG